MPFNDFPFSKRIFFLIIVAGWRSGGGLCWRATRRGITSRRLIETMGRGAGFGRLPVLQKLPIGSKDLPMPEKTHSRSRRDRHCCLDLLKLLRWPIAQSRVQPAAVVIPINELGDVRSQMVEIPVLVGVNLFPLQRFHKAFATGV